MSNFRIKICASKGCDKTFKQYNSLIVYCSPECKIKNQKPKSNKIYAKPNKVSEKRLKLVPVYEKVRIEVLSESKFKCFIDGCNNVANTVEHKMGRKGFADDWARENNIPLLIDKRYLAACCSFHNTELERNPELSIEYQLSKIHGGKKTIKTKNMKEKIENTNFTVRSIIANKLDVDENEVVGDAVFTNDLGADSIDMIEIVMELEKEFDITIEAEKYEKIKTVSECYDLINTLIN